MGTGSLFCTCSSKRRRERGGGGGGGGGMYTRSSKNERKPAKHPHVRVEVHRLYFFSISKFNVISRHSCFVFTACGFVQILSKYF